MMALQLSYTGYYDYIRFSYLGGQLSTVHLCKLALNHSLHSFADIAQKQTSHTINRKFQRIIEDMQINKLSVSESTVILQAAKGLTIKTAALFLDEYDPIELTLGGFFNILLWIESVLCFIAYGIDQSDIKDPTNVN